MASAMTVAAQTAVPKSEAWGTGEWSDTYMGMTWDKHWNSDTKTLGASTTSEAAKWMAALPDRMFVAHVSIPGAHDFATGEENWVTSAANGKATSTTQAVTMREQMDRGIRGIDLRPGMYDGVLYCNHGLAQTNKTLEEAVKDMVAFLDEHPSEFFVVHFFRGNIYRTGEMPTGSGLLGAKGNAASRNEYNELMQKLFDDTYKNYVIDYRPNLTVEEARGKMVLFTRDRIDFVHLSKQARLTNWDAANNDTEVAAIATNESNAMRSTKLWVQDLSSGADVTTKVTRFQRQAERMQAMPTPKSVYDAGGEYLSEWCMNFTSMEYDSSESGSSYSTNKYKYGAKAMAPVAIDFLKKNAGAGPVGIFFSDYVLRTSSQLHNGSDRVPVYGDELVYRIIENNFAGENPPVVKYAIPDDVNVSTYPNPYEGKTYFMRHKASGQWFCGGANYGSHAALDKYGYPLTLKVNAETGDVTIAIGGGGSFYRDGSGYAYVDGATGDNYRLIPAQTANTYALTVDNSTKALTAFAYGAPSNHQYADNLDYWLDFDTYRAGDANQEFELVTLDERQTELLTKANPNRPYDATFYQPGYSSGNGWDGLDQFSFESKYKIGITYNGNATRTQRNNWRGAFTMIYNLGNSGAGYKSKWKMDRTITGLPNGKYKVDFQAFSWNQANKTTYTIGGVGGTVADKTLSNFTSLSNDIFKKDDNGNEINNIDPILDVFKNEADIKHEFDVTVSGGSLSIHFEMQDNKASETAFFLDNIHLTYYGPENKAEETVQVNFPEHWNTVILPFDVSESYISSNVNKDGKDYIFYQVDKEKGGYKETSKVLQENQNKEYFYHVVQLSDAVSSLKANTPYIVENKLVEEVEPKPEEIGTETQSAFAAPARAAATDNTYLETFVGHPTNYEDTYTDAGNFLTGVLADNHIVGEGHYPLVKANYQMFAQLTDAQTAPVAKYHAYVHSGAETAEHPIILFKDVDNVLTGVEDVAAEEHGITDETPVDVYTTGGILLRSKVAKADALTDLPRGIYILAAPQGALKVAK